MSPTRGVTAAVVAAGACLASLFPEWAAADTGGGFFDLIARSSAVTAFCGVMYLLLTLVAAGLASAAAFSPPGFRWYVAGAGLAAVLDAVAVGGIGYRIWDAGLVPGAGWYVSLAAVLASCVAVAGSMTGHPPREADSAGT